MTSSPGAEFEYEGLRIVNEIPEKLDKILHSVYFFDLEGFPRQHAGDFFIFPLTPGGIVFYKSSTSISQSEHGRLHRAEAFSQPGLFVFQMRSKTEGAVK